MERSTPFPNHSQREWEAIRDIFKKLYVDEDLTLEEVRDRLGQRGFHASVKQFKLRIRRWKLDKNNKESDMVFMIRKIDQRKNAGKATVFQVRGQPKTMQEIERYWRRKRAKTRAQSPFPSTPSDVDYWTPPASTAVSPVPMQSDLTLMDDYTPTLPLDRHEIYKSLVYQALWTNDSIRPPLSSPGHLNFMERFLHYINEMYGVRFGSHCDESEDLYFTATTRKFEHLMERAVMKEVQGSASYSAQLAQREMYQMIPDVLRERDPSFGILILEHLVHHVFMETSASYITDVLNIMIECEAGIKLSRHPFVASLGLLLQSFETSYEMAETIMAKLVAYMSLLLGECHAMTCLYREVLESVTVGSGNLGGAVEYCENHIVTYRRAYQNSGRRRFLDLILESQSHLAWTYVARGNHGEAEALIDQTLAECRRNSCVDSRVLLQVLHARSWLNDALGFKDIEALEEALNLSIEILGVDSFQTCCAAKDLQEAINDAHEELQICT